MNCIEMVVCFLWCLVCNHLLRWAFEAHTLVTSSTEYFIAAIYLDYWHSAVGIRTLSYVVFSHVFEEICICLTYFDGLITGKTWMNYFLNKYWHTLHLLQ